MFENWTSKDFRKAAFAVGFGVTFGKSIAHITGKLLETGVESIMRSMAKHDVEFAKDVCDKVKIKYDKPKENEEKSEIKMGFHMQRARV